MASKTEIANLAGGHLGVGGSIGNLETAKEPLAVACRKFYDIALKATLKDFEWPFATSFKELNLIDEDPTDEWDYSYGYPSDCIQFRRILSGDRVDTKDSRVPYKRAIINDKAVILTDKEDAVAELTLFIEDPSFYPPDFVIAFSLRLAAYIAPSLVSGDPQNLGEKTLKKYYLEIGASKMNNAVEESEDNEPESELITSRES